MWIIVVDRYLFIDEEVRRAAAFDDDLPFGDRGCDFSGFDIGYKGVASSRHGCNKDRRLFFLTEDFSESRYLHRNVCFLDKLILPYELHQLVLGDNAAAVFDKHHQQVESFCVERNRFPGASQLPARRVEPIFPEIEDVARHFASSLGTLGRSVAKFRILFAAVRAYYAPRLGTRLY